MEPSSIWVNDLLEAVNNNDNSGVKKLIEKCGEKCAVRNHTTEFMEKLGNSASYCKTRTEIVEFLSNQISAKFTEEWDGIVMRLGKTQCTCPMAQMLCGDIGALCNCTCGHEKAGWSAFFGKPVDVEILESFLRGGQDCVIKIKV